MRAMKAGIQITEAASNEAAELASIHVAARRQAMPYLPDLHTEKEIRDWFVGRLTDAPNAFQVARVDGRIVGYLALHDVELDDLYVRPEHQGCGVGSALLDKAKAMSPRQPLLSTFQRNTRAREFYKARGFREIGCTDGKNEERLPDVQYEWCGP
jgi:ribosomal protein S18 acetylase RimI-like enzyme